MSKVHVVDTVEVTLDSYDFEEFCKLWNKGEIVDTHRNHYHALLHGLSPDDMEQKILDGRSMFMYDREKNFFASAIVGGIPGIAAVREARRALDDVGKSGDVTGSNHTGN